MKRKLKGISFSKGEEGKEGGRGGGEISPSWIGTEVGVYLGGSGGGEVNTIRISCMKLSKI